MPWGIIPISYDSSSSNISSVLMEDQHDKCATAVLLGLLLAIGPPVRSATSHNLNRLMVQRCKLKRYTIPSNSIYPKSGKIFATGLLDNCQGVSAHFQALRFGPRTFGLESRTWSGANWLMHCFLRQLACWHLFGTAKG